MEPVLIKNKKLYIGEKVIKGITTHMIKDNSKLGDVFNYLPCGIIDKTETGIGGTSLELDCKRNSIIVQPYANIAWLKAKMKSVSNGFTVFFYGIKKNAQKKRKGQIRTIGIELSLEQRNLNLQEYVDSCIINKQYIKITCVTDQLKNIKEYLNCKQEGYFETFHLLLDEIDSLQEQSTFRPVMDECYSIYKEHPQNKKTVISATLIKFHDPDLVQDSRTRFKYQNKVIRNISVIKASNTEQECLLRIKKQKILDVDHKIVVAYNSINSCKRITEYLVQSKTCKASEVKIICSTASEDKAGKFYDFIDEDGVLPGKINFITAAYFNGVDINEQYHSFIIADSTIKTLVLSPSVIYQISGRGRFGLLSNVLIVKATSVPHQNFTLEDFSIFEQEKRGFETFLENLSSSASKYGKSLAIELRNVFIDGTENLSGVLKGKGNKIELSYIKVDSILERQKTLDMYSNYKTFMLNLAEKFSVQQEAPFYQNKTQKQNLKGDVILRCKELLQKLKNVINTSDVKKQIQKIEAGLEAPSYPSDYVLCRIYELAFMHENVDMNKLSTVIEGLIKSEKTIKSLKFIRNHLAFMLYAYPEQAVKDLFETSFIMGHKYTVDEFNKSSKSFARSLKAQAKTLNPEVKKIADEIYKKPSLIKDALLNAQPTRLTGTRFCTIKSHLKFDIYCADYSL